LIFTADLSLSAPLALSGCKSINFGSPDKNSATFSEILRYFPKDFKNRAHGGQTHLVALPEFRSPVGRAVAPVLAGLGFFLVLGLIMWGIAALMAGEQAQTTTFTPDRLPIGNVDQWAESIDTDGPVLFPGLGTTSGERTIVLDHNGTDSERGWVVYYAFPADRDVSCAIEQIVGTDTFTDCDGRTISVEDLAPPTNGEYPVIEDRVALFIDLGERANDVTTTIAG
jgi:hypothetical protein